ncbi:MAG: recombinase family protein, partial [Alphaproteobacteria bacterium]|nr:recombinase family protein [Alphaproteobacteria bacterium]
YDASEAYIRSQAHAGWTLIKMRYDDGGFSGGSTDRPALQKLLDDVRAHKINVIVVYKVDRLTRSLADFAKLVELFDAHQVSFVSITQSFNTTSSMGRLTLNILLSFAQFEREVIGERVRDKIAASKRKGLWMGGNAPMGFIARDKKLVVIPDEAETVRMIFRRYLALGSTGLLLKDLRRRGIKTKKRVWAGKLVGGVWFGKGALTHLLKNRAYIGELVHRGEIYPADHEAIMDRELFEAVQAKLQFNTHTRKLKLRASPYLLTGLLYDSAGNRMSPSCTLKKGIRYRYYVSQGLLQSHDVSTLGEVTRASAPDLEAVVTAFLHQEIKVSGAAFEAMHTHIERVTIRTDHLELRL